VERSAETTRDDPDGEYLKRNRWFESGSLQRRVSNELYRRWASMEPLLALRAQLLHASPDRREIVGSAGSPMSGARSYLVTRRRLGAYGWPQYRQVPNPPSPSSGRTIDGAGGTVSRAHKKLLLRTDGRTECRRS
jgi:hypothetical protein